jgi:hypothetical protein
MQSVTLALAATLALGVGAAMAQGTSGTMAQASATVNGSNQAGSSPSQKGTAMPETIPEIRQHPGAASGGGGGGK